MKRTMAGVGAALFLLAASCSTSNADDPEGLELRAIDACTQFVKDKLPAESTSEFPDPDDGEVRTTQDGDEWTVVSQVHAESSFGGTVTTPFKCTVRHTGAQNWRVIDLSPRRVTRD